MANDKDKTRILIYQSTANLDVKILFNKITHFLDSEIWKMPVRDLYRNKNSTFDSGP